MNPQRKNAASSTRIGSSLTGILRYPVAASTPRVPTVRTISPTYNGVPGRWIYAKALSSSR